MDEFTFTSFDHLESKLEKCDDCCNGDYMSFHCPLCPVSKYKPRKKAKLQQHLAVHWNTRIQGNNDSYSVVCHLQHGDISTRHFHCTCCGKIIKKKENMVTHLRKCQINNKEHTEDNSPKGTTNLVTDNSIPHLDKSFNEHDYSYKSRVSKSVPMSPKKSKSKKACQICGKLVSKRWMRSHMKIHKKENNGQNEINQHRHHYTALVDINSGIYCSATNLSGPLYPVHAIKMTSGANQDSFCENQQCIDSKDTAKRGGNIAYECAHIRSVPYAVRGKDIILQDTTLMALKSQSFITEARSAELLQLKETLTKSGSPLAVEIPPMENASSRYRYFSVSTGSPKYWSRTYRTIVSYDSTLNKYTCKCSNAARYCMHKAIAKCCIYQETPNFFTNEEGVNLDDNNVTSFDYENDTESQGVLKKDKIKFDLMLNYIASMKKIPANPEVENALYERTSFLQENKITARETSCHKCDGDLALEKISSRSKIVTMRKIFKDVEVYVKVCPRCRTVYRFQEWIEGIHNYNNTLFLGIDVCRFLRAGLINHVALGRSLAVLEEMLTERLNIMEIEKAYLHFEALSDHIYDYNCVMCGFYPSIMIWDTFRKAAFRFAVSDLKESSKVISDTINVKEFWGKIEEDILLRSLSNENCTNVAFAPDFNFWSPWIGPNSRNSDFVYNTEYKKCSSGNSDEINEPIPEELLMHLLLDEKVTAIRRVCREVGIKGDGSSMDMILRLREKSITKSSFDRAYEKVFGCSGGWAVGCCRHGVVYAIKNLLRSESPRDYIDMERSLKHRPTVTISDIAHLMATHGNKTVPEFFHPNEGRLDIVSDETIEGVASGSVTYSLPFLKDTVEGDYIEETNFNPSTGTSDHFSLYDWFHQDNCRKKEETLRKSSLVKEISGFVDTQTVEQLFSSSKKDIYFLNNMTPRNHLFFFRLIYHLRNEKINSKILLKQKKALGTPLQFNHYGQIYKEYLPNESNEFIYEAVAVSPELNTHDTGDTYTVIHREEDLVMPENTELSNVDIPMCDVDLLRDFTTAVTLQIKSLSQEEHSNFQYNMRYINEVLFKHPERKRQEQVKFISTEFGLFQCQGFSNYCGLCCLNNALGIADIRAAITVEEMDTISDQIWMSMVNNPAQGLTVALEPMRDKEGFYSVEVLHWVLKVKGYEMHKLNAAAIKPLTTTETGNNLIGHLMSEFRMAVLIIRPRTSQHWISIRYLNDTVMFLDSKVKAPRIITYEELGDYVLQNSDDPGAVYFLSSSHESTQDVHIPNKTSNSEMDVNMQHEKKLYDLRENPPQKRRSNHVYDIPKKNKRVHVPDITKNVQIEPDEDDTDTCDDSSARSATNISSTKDLPFDDTDELPDIVDNPPEDKDEEYKPKSREDKERAKIKYIKERNQQKRNNLEQFREGLNPHQLHRLHETASDIYNYFNNIITDNKLKPANEGLFWSNRLHKEDEEITVVATTIGDTTISYVDSIILSDANATINESDMEELFALIFHEFVHAYLFVHGLSDYSDHGPVWNRKMKQLMRLVKTNRHLRPARIKDVNIEENRVRTHAGRKR